MSLYRLRWLTIVVAITFLLCVQGVAMGLVMPAFGRMYGHATSITAFSVGVVVFTLAIYRVIDVMQRRIVRQNEELSAVNAVSQAVAGSLDLDKSMTAALSDVMQVTRAVAGQILVPGNDGGQARSFSEGTRHYLSLLERLRADGETKHGGRRLVTIPIESQDRQLGTLSLLVGEETDLTPEAGDSIFAAIGAQIGIAVQAANLYSDVLRRERESQALYEIAVDITSFHNAEGILPSIVERAREMIGGDAAALCLANSAEGGVVLTARSGCPETFRLHPSGMPWMPLTSLADLGGGDGRFPSCPFDGESFSTVHAPLRVGARCVGELCVSGRKPRQFTSEDKHLIDAMADLAAISVQKATLLEKERQVAVLEERERLSREMHDSLAQVLGYLHLKAQETRRILERDDLEKVESELEDMASVAQEAYADVREAIIGLRETVSQDGGIAGTLREYLSKYSRRAGIPTDLLIDGDWHPTFSPEVAVQLVRVVQEALTNVRKHANADRARVRIGLEGSEAVIVVEDNGRGFDAELMRQTDVLSFGLRTMRERVERVGGRFAVESVPGEGTRVQIFLPVNGRHDHDS